MPSKLDLPPLDDQQQAQLALFRYAVDLLGGRRATAAALNIDERMVRYVLAGDRALHEGFLRDTAAALIDHADRCRALEKQLNPLFVANLTPRQRHNLVERERAGLRLKQGGS